jgi:hypothetical protein
MLSHKYRLILSLFLPALFLSCNGNVNSGKKNSDNKIQTLIMSEQQISFSEKNHALDNNDNFSADDRFLCYDTRGTVYDQNLANCKSVEKIEIATGKETVLWNPESVTGKDAAPGVAAASYHPKEDKIIFIHGPLLTEVKERGYYGIRNRTGVEVSADGKKNITKVDMRDVATDRPTTPGAQRGGTHRHEYSRDGKRVGFTYDDFLVQDYDRTIGYMEANPKAPEGYTHYFSLLVKPAKKGEAKPGEIEKAHSDSWVDTKGRMRAFIGKVRAENGVDYENSLFVAGIPDDVDITTAIAGTATEYPTPAKGISIRRLTHKSNDDGIVRGSFSGDKIAYLSEDSKGVKQVFIISADGSDLSEDPGKQPKQVTHFSSDASSLRWHPTDKWIFSVCNGNIAASYIGEGEQFGKTFFLTNDNKERTQLVVSHNGKVIAYGMKVGSKSSDKSFTQIFVMNIDIDNLNNKIEQ